MGKSIEPTNKTQTPAPNKSCCTPTKAVLAIAALVAVVAICWGAYGTFTNISSMPGWAAKTYQSLPTWVAPTAMGAAGMFLLGGLINTAVCSCKSVKGGKRSPSANILITMLALTLIAGAAWGAVGTFTAPSHLPQWLQNTYQVPTWVMPTTMGAAGTFLLFVIANSAAYSCQGKKHSEKNKKVETAAVAGEKALTHTTEPKGLWTEEQRGKIANAKRCFIDGNPEQAAQLNELFPEELNEDETAEFFWIFSQVRNKDHAIRIYQAMQKEQISYDDALIKIPPFIPSWPTQE